MDNGAILAITFLFGGCGMISTTIMLGGLRKKKARWTRPIASPPEPPNPTPRVIIGGIIAIAIIGLPIVGGLMAIIWSVMEMLRAF